MGHYTLIARINAGDGKFPFVNLQFSKKHRPIPIEGELTTSVRATGAAVLQSESEKISIRRSQLLLNMEDCKTPNNIAALPTTRASVVPSTVPRKTITEAAREYIERSSQKSRKNLYWLSHRRQSICPELQEAVLR